MIEQCPECKEKITILEIQEAEPDTTSSMTVTTGTYDFTFGTVYASTIRTYKCCNPKCWVTKIEESWK